MLINTYNSFNMIVDISLVFTVKGYLNIMGEEKKVVPRKAKTVSEQRMETKIDKKARRFKQGGVSAETLTSATQKSAEYVSNVSAGYETDVPETPTAESTATKPIWDSCEDLRQQCWVLYASAGNNHNLLRHPSVVKSVYKDDMIKLGRQLLTDMGLARTKLETIHPMHTGKTGEADSPDDHFKAAAIGSEYVNWLNNFTDVVIPLTIDISALAAKADAEANPEASDAIVTNIDG
jgi:hypothetical protein